MMVLRMLKEWEIILDKMIATMEYLIKEENYPIEKDKVAMVEEGIGLFHKHFFSLWD